MKKIRLNTSQRAIYASETVYKKSAQNVISIKLEFKGLEPPHVKAAAQEALRSADIFTAVLHIGEDGAYFVPGERDAAECVLLARMTRGEAYAYAREKDAEPLPYPQILYEAFAIPLQEGGTMLYIRFHHIIIDGYGMCLFAQNVIRVLEGRPARTSVFFAKNAQGAGADEAQKEAYGKFWREYFSDAAFEPAIFSEHPKSTEKKTVPYIPQDGFKDKVWRYARQNGITGSYVLAAAYAIYLSQATGRKDAVFLAPRLNRREDERDIIGCYVLLVPVCVAVEPKDTFADVCRKTQESARISSEGKSFGFENILRVLREENLLGSGLSEYGFNFYRYEINTEIDCAMELSVAGAMHGHLTWNIFQARGNLSYALDCRDGIYDALRAEYFAESIDRILTCGMEGMAVRDIPVVGKREEAQLSLVRGKEIEIDEQATIPSLFRNAAAKYAERPALYAGDAALTFAQLDRVTDQVAAGLAAKGVGSGDFVAFMLKRDIRLIPIMIGIAKTGAAFIPVDPDYPKDRVDYIIEDSRAKLLISVKDVEAAADYAYIEADSLLREEGSFAAPSIDAGSPAYVIYTSGTTGKPKGVILSHKGIANIVHPDNNPFNRDIAQNGAGIVAIGSVCFDISLFEIFVPLLNGLFVEFGNEKSMVDAAELAKHIMRHGADILHCTPSRLASYLSNSDFATALNGVKAVLAAGEVLPGAFVDELKDRYNIRVYNGYGPTETTIGATITEAGDAKTIGKPIANMGLLLLNGNSVQVPYGAAGEICVYGMGVGIGYKGRKEETAAKFTDYNGTRIYHTGDVGRLLEDGRLTYHGRIDRQVKLRGLRIELAEIENVMGTFPGISQAVCIIKKMEKSEHLAGFFTAETGAAVDAEQLKAFLKTKLTPYMVPDILKGLENMPQTPGGKTDLNALSQMPLEFAAQYRAPESETEIAVCKAFAKVLGIERAGLDDNFFELGGDSLSAVELMVNVEKELNLSEASGIDYGDVFEHPTPALLAALLDGSRAKKSLPIDNLDYTGIDEYLSGTGKGKDGRKLGNVLITGATGYLGIHILIDLLRNEDTCEKIFCLVRGGGKRTPVQRMKNSLFYYAEDDFSESYGEKWVVAEGDITKPQLFDQPFTEHIDTIINSAANVSHFVYGDSLERVNVDGVKNLTAFALRQGALLCHVSTISVGGLCDDSKEASAYTERSLYVGQKIFNQYIYSKFLAEHALLRAAVDQGLSVKIMRVGNLQGRSRDGEFQMNMRTNAFTRQLAAYIKIGAAPQSIYDATVNFSPVDETAHNIVALAKTALCYPVFHVYPPDEVAYSRLFMALGRMGHDIRVLSDKEFEAVLQQQKLTEEGRSMIEGLLVEKPADGYRWIPVVQEATDRLLNESGESWLPVTEAYLDNYLNALEGMDMF